MSSTTSVQLGIVLNINGTNVSLKPTETSQAPNQVAANGVTYALSEPANIGTVSDLTQSIGSLLGIHFSLPKTSSWPAPLNAIASFVDNLDITILKFKLFIPGTKSKHTEKQFTIAFRATANQASEDLELLGTIKLAGLYLEFSNVAPSS